MQSFRYLGVHVGLEREHPGWTAEGGDCSGPPWPYAEAECALYFGCIVLQQWREAAEGGSVLGTISEPVSVGADSRVLRGMLATSTLTLSRQRKLFTSSFTLPQSKGYADASSGPLPQTLHALFRAVGSNLEKKLIFGLLINLDFSNSVHSWDEGQGSEEEHESGLTAGLHAV